MQLSFSPKLKQTQRENHLKKNLSTRWRDYHERAAHTTHRIFIYLHIVLYEKSETFWEAGTFSRFEPCVLR